MRRNARLQHRASAFALSLLVLLLLSTPASALEFNQSIELDGYPIQLVMNDEHEKVARYVARIIEREIPHVASQLGLESVSNIRVEISDDMNAYRDSGTNLPRWGVAFALMSQQVMVVDVDRASNAMNSLDQVIPHELSHLLLAQRVGRVPMPIWFVEGLAQWQAGEWSLVSNWMLMNAVWSNRAPKLNYLLDRYPSGAEAARDAYRLSYMAVVEMFGGRWHDLPDFLQSVAARGDFVAPFEATTGTTLLGFGAEFDARLREKYRSRLLLFQSGPLFSVSAALFIVLGGIYLWRRRRRYRAMKDEWERELES